MFDLSPHDQWPVKRCSGSMPRRGLTLIELIFVLAIMAATVALVIPRLGSTRIETATGLMKTEKQIVTETTMRKIRDTIMGTADRQGVWADLGQRPELFPRNPDYLLRDHSDVILLAPEYSGLQQFDPVTKIGWRGPYLVGLSNTIDAWGNDLRIQIDFNEDDMVTSGEAQYARLVSAGPNQIYDTTLADGIVPGDNSPTSELSLAECGDDIVLFFRVADTRQ